MVAGLKKAVGQPLVQFAILAALFYGLYAWMGGSRAREPDNVIYVSAGDINRLDASWRARWNRPPTQEELAGLMRDHVREIALYRHAMAMGLDQNDAVLRRMLGQKLQTLSQNLVELSLSPTDQELEAYFEANAERYRPPERITFTHVFIDPDRRGDATLQDAAEIKARLRSLGEPTEEMARLGDPFMLQRYYPRKTELEIVKLFGQGFTESVFELSPGEWHGPVLSGYGTHVVYVHHLEDTATPELETVRDEVKQDWMNKRRRELQDEYIDAVVASYEVVLEDMPPNKRDKDDTDESEARLGIAK